MTTWTAKTKASTSWTARVKAVSAWTAKARNIFFDGFLATEDGDYIVTNSGLKILVKPAEGTFTSKPRIL